MARLVVGIIVALFTLSGCGTMVGNLSGLGASHYMEIYGGVQTDVEAGVKCIRAVGQPDGQPVSLFGGAYLLLVDLPLSAAADTITLPWTIKAALDGEAGSRAWGKMMQPAVADKAGAGKPANDTTIE